MAYKEAKESFGQMIRWTEQPKDAKEGENTIFLGNIVTGFYVNKKEGVGQNESTVYELKLADGQVVSFWGSDLLDGKFQEIPLGCEVRVTYLGTAQPKTPKGRAYRNFRVEYDETSRMPMKSAGPTTETGASKAQAPVGSDQHANQQFDAIPERGQATDQTSGGDGF